MSFSQVCEDPEPERNHGNNLASKFRLLACHGNPSHEVVGMTEGLGFIPIVEPILQILHRREDSGAGESA
jgi:hypothetical protein